uniref:Uncharacterized protein n=1 Tax=Romanomermis culicivorax TaxID=13658 RepID=A0A915HZR5_ROMCU
MDRAQNRYRECSLSTDRRPQNSVLLPTKFVSFQPQVLKQPPQQPPRTEVLLEQLIQRYDHDYVEQKSRLCPVEILPPQSTTKSTPSISKQRIIRKSFDRSASRDRTCTTQPTGLWCDAHKSRTHNTDDWVWLKRQNAQQLTRQEPNRPTYTAHPMQADF